MKKSKENCSTVHCDMPELDDVIAKLGCHESEKPPYVIVGLIKLPTIGWCGGILAHAKTEWNAYLIKKLFVPYGDVSVKHTEHHSGGMTFSSENTKVLDELLKTRKKPSNK